MRRLIVLPLAAALFVLSFTPVQAAPLSGSATVAIDDATPVYGQTVTLTAEIESDDQAQIRTICTHAAGQSYGHSIITDADTIVDDVGLYAPNWPESPATCVANVTLLDYSRHGVLKKTLVIATVTFEVAA